MSLLKRKTPKPIETGTTSAQEEQLRKPYFKPYLQDLGDLRTLTLGASPGLTPDTSGAPEEFFQL